MKLNYTLNGDYLLPNLTIKNQNTNRINKYGYLRLHYLKENKKTLYTTLLMTNELTNHLISVSKNSEERLLMLDGIEYCISLAKELKLIDLVLDCYRKYFETIVRFLDMIKDKNTIDREELKNILVENFNLKYSEAINLINNETEAYRKKFENLREKFEKAKKDRIEID